MAGYEAGGRYLGSRGAMDVNQAEMTVTLTPRNKRPRSIWDVMDSVREKTNSIPGVTLLILKEKAALRARQQSLRLMCVFLAQSKNSLIH